MLDGWLCVNILSRRSYLIFPLFSSNLISVLPCFIFKCALKSIFSITLAAQLKKKIYKHGSLHPSSTWVWSMELKLWSIGWESTKLNVDSPRCKSKRAPDIREISKVLTVESQDTTHFWQTYCTSKTNS